jgi:hypothetical protein
MNRAARITTALIAAVAALVFGVPTAACEPASIGTAAARVNGASFVLLWQPQPALRTGEFFSVLLSVCARSARTIDTVRVDATMPAHRHGMNYRPTLKALGAGRFEAAGLLLYMPGRWEFAFDIAAGSRRESLRAQVDVP